jgi:conjugal transfer pilus assembly protein TraW
MKKKTLIGLVVATAVCSVVALAQSNSSTLVTEKMGPTYAIQETDAIEAIQNKLKAMEKSGELEKIKDQAKARIEGQILEPAPIAGIRLVDKPGVRYFDPTFILGEDIFDHEGNRIAAMGTRVNPLDVMPVRKKLFFFDGRSDAQVALAAKLAQTYGSDFTPILTAGSWVKTSEKLQQAVFYDQLGKMSTRLTITSVPALVMQEGSKMRIEEMQP